jgi:predicted XRE-type DNA-binding protein
MRKDKSFADRRIIESSGNVFADLGLPNPDEELLKAKLIWQISDTIGARKLTQGEAAKLLGLKQPDVSSLLHGKTNDFSVDRLLRLLNRLGKDVKITVKTKPRSRPAQITVEAA